jgi:xanthine dehydrogenase YagS FAD-binding subunit
MRPFVYERAASPDVAIRAFLADRKSGDGARGAEFLAGGTTLLDLMKLDVMRPAAVVDINPLGRTDMGTIAFGEQGVTFGALVRMSDAAEHPDIRRDYPVIAQSLQLAASQQLRNMASLAGNVLQRTRCPYFRDVTYRSCNKRSPGSGCAAMDGYNRMHAVLGTSDKCIATYPGDFAQALIALDAAVAIQGANGRRMIAFAALHRLPGDTPDLETALAPGELIEAFFVPALPWARRSLYLKVRDRQSYEFALASAAVALDLEDGRVRDARIALGGVATVPWRAKAAEAALKNRALDDEAAQAAAEAAFAGAAGQTYNAFKIALGKRTLVRALRQAASMEL